MIDPYLLHSPYQPKDGRAESRQIAQQIEAKELAAAIAAARQQIAQATATERDAVATAQRLVAAAEKQATIEQAALAQHQASEIPESKLASWAATNAKLEDTARAAGVVVTRAQQGLEAAQEAYSAALRTARANAQQDAQRALDAAHSERQRAIRILHEQIAKLEQTAAQTLWPLRNTVVAFDSLKDV